MRLPPFPVFPYSGNMPDFYRNEQSEEAVVAKLCEWVCKLQEYVNDQTDNFNGIQEAYEQLEELFEKFQESGFDDYYADQVREWIGENLQRIVDAMTVSTVYFGLTDDGYFTAYYPVSWKTVQFDTIADYDNPYYGCLCLFY